MNSPEKAIRLYPIHVSFSRIKTKNNTRAWLYYVASHLLLLYILFLRPPTRMWRLQCTCFSGSMTVEKKYIDNFLPAGVNMFQWIDLFDIKTYFGCSIIGEIRLNSDKTRNREYWHTLIMCMQRRLLNAWSVAIGI